MRILFNHYICNMRAVIQRVKKASVTIAGACKSEIGGGLLILIGIGREDTGEDTLRLCKKIAKMRIFSDEKGKMNLSVEETNGEILVISQFTLFASTKKGNRPSYTKAAPPEVAKPKYEEFCRILENETAKKVQTGEFGAEMQVNIVNDGPVTIVMDTKQEE